MRLHQDRTENTVSAISLQNKIPVEEEEQTFFDNTKYSDKLRIILAFI